jgi:flagellar motor switch protein FliN/FliY
MNAPAESAPNVEILLDLPIKLSVELGTCQIPMKEVLQFHPGSVVPLEKAPDAPVDIFVNQKLVARGEVVVLEDRLAIRLTEVIGKAA